MPTALPSTEIFAPGGVVTTSMRPRTLSNLNVSVMSPPLATWTVRVTGAWPESSTRISCAPAAIDSAVAGDIPWKLPSTYTFALSGSVTTVRRAGRPSSFTARFLRSPADMPTDCSASLKPSFRNVSTAPPRGTITSTGVTPRSIPFTSTLAPAGSEVQ